MEFLKNAEFGYAMTQDQKLLSVDVDDSGSSKDGVDRTYKGHDGYVPIFCIYLEPTLFSRHRIAERHST